MIEATKLGDKSGKNWEKAHFHQRLQPYLCILQLRIIASATGQKETSEKNNLSTD
jgi:hypothetical protein